VAVLSLCCAARQCDFVKIIHFSSSQHADTSSLLLSQVVQWNLAQLANAFVKGELLDIVSLYAFHGLIHCHLVDAGAACMCVSELSCWCIAVLLLINSCCSTDLCHLTHAAGSSGHPEEVLGGALHGVQRQDMREAGTPAL